MFIVCLSTTRAQVRWFLMCYGSSSLPPCSEQCSVNIVEWWVSPQPQYLSFTQWVNNKGWSPNLVKCWEENENVFLSLYKVVQREGGKSLRQPLQTKHRIQPTQPLSPQKPTYGENSKVIIVWMRPFSFLVLDIPHREENGYICNVYLALVKDFVH